MKSVSLCATVQRFYAASAYISVIICLSSTTLSAQRLITTTPVIPKVVVPKVITKKALSKSVSLGFAAETDLTSKLSVSKAVSHTLVRNAEAQSLSLGGGLAGTEATTSLTFADKDNFSSDATRSTSFAFMGGSGAVDYSLDYAVSGAGSDRVFTQLKTSEKGLSLRTGSLNGGAAVVSDPLELRAPLDANRWYKVVMDTVSTGENYTLKAQIVDLGEDKMLSIPLGSTPDFKTSQPNLFGSLSVDVTAGIKTYSQLTNSIAIDDLSFRFEGVPEPSAALLSMLVGSFVFMRRQKH